MSIDAHLDEADYPIENDTFHDVIRMCVARNKAEQDSVVREMWLKMKPPTGKKFVSFEIRFLRDEKVLRILYILLRLKAGLINETSYCNFYTVLKH